MPQKQLVGFIALLLWACTGAATAQDYPARPIRVIVPFAAGSIVDIVPRLIFERVSAELGQPFVVENKPGAGSTIGSTAVAHAKPDGYTILVNSSAHTIAPSLYRNLPYDTERDFSAIVPIVSITDLLVISPSKGIKSVREFVANAKASPQPVTFASLGTGSAIFLNAERFRVSAGFQATQVPFRGAPAAIKEVIAGDVHFCFCAIGTTQAYIKSHQLLALAVSSRKRSPLFPDVPTTLQAGYPNSDYTPWIGVFAPAKTPRSIIERLHDAIVVAENAPDIAAKLKALGLEPMTMSSQDFSELVRADMKRNKALLAKIGLLAH